VFVSTIRDDQNDQDVYKPPIQNEMVRPPQETMLEKGIDDMNNFFMKVN
jgi:hypothetical protein